MSPAATGFAILGLAIMVIGLVLAFAVNDRFLGLALVLVGAFLLFLPFTRPSLDE